MNKAGGVECPSDIRLNVKSMVSPAMANVGSFHDLYIINKYLYYILYIARTVYY